MIAWMLWATLVATLVAAAAYLLEDVLGSLGRPTRWVWCAALCGTVGLIGWSALPRDARGSSSTTSVPLPIEVAQDWWTGEEGLRARVTLRRLDPFFTGAWIVASSLLLVGLCGGLWRLRRRAATWPTRRIAEHDVLLSDGFGPALLGFWRPRIVLPERLLAHAPEDLAVVCLHEAQHRAARDTWLLGGSALFAVALPWNPAVWWQVMRLRGAIEIDCDRRVLGAGIVPATYANLLLNVDRRGARRGILAPTLLESPPPLERRLTMVLQGLKRKSTAATLGALAASASLLFVACETPAPAGPLDASGLVIRQLDQVGQNGLAPLVVLDGVVLDAQTFPLPDLDPDDIASIEVIRAATAVPVFGDRAGGGVIVVKTTAFGAPAAPADPAQALARLQERANTDLVVVDGVVQDDLGAIEERLRTGDNIASVEVIKGAAALRLFGEQAANGVISITTKARWRPLARLSEQTNVDLVIVDGVAQDDPRAFLDRANTDDIESVEVIRGPEAVRLFGDRAADGVIAITTRAR